MTQRTWMAWAIVGVAVLGLLAAGAYGGSGSSKSAKMSSSAKMVPSVKVGNETLSKLSTEVTVTSAYSEGPGWIVIHESGQNGAGALVGYAALKSGMNRNITVTLNRPAKDGERFYAMLHVDKGKVGTFEDPGADTPVMGANAQIVEEPFVVSVPAGTPAVRLTVAEAGPSACTLSSVEPKSFSDAIGPEKEHPTLTLHSGWRYEIDDPGVAAQQFELVQRGMNGSSDVVLLSQAGSGSLQSDPSIGWSAQKGEVRFTVSSDLSKQLSGYRCGAAASEAPGTVKVM